MTVYAERSGLSVAQPIVDFAEQTLTTYGLDHERFWAGVAGIVEDLTPANEILLATRDALQQRVDGYHRDSPGVPDPEAYRSFLADIGYLRDVPIAVQVTTQNVDPEISEVAGPQLVVPLLNARFAINAVNARWGSLYDALYGTDAISPTAPLEIGDEYNPRRGAAVIAAGRDLLDRVAPLVDGSHAEAVAYTIVNRRLQIALSGSRTTTLADHGVLVGFSGDRQAPTHILLLHHGLHLDIVIDNTGPNGNNDPAGIQDIEIEAALTTIMDLEDSVAAVDADDKALGYSNWRGLMEGTLSQVVTKGGRSFIRSMNPDRSYFRPDGTAFQLSGRSVMFVRNVGHLMRTPAMLDSSGSEVFEGILDAIMTTLGALGDVKATAPVRNSRTRSLYIVKPKMHGPDEVGFATALFSRVERLLGLPEATIKVGIMDEERRTSANLAACISKAADRIVFINTGFLDRTGDEIRTSMYAGPMLPKSEIRRQPWLEAYEERNVSIGVECGLTGHGQIGKGMWAMPDLMRDMLDQKIEHVASGASTAWVPSPTAATLHALHYHEVDAFAVRRELEAVAEDALSLLLQIPLATTGELTPAIVQTELEHNAQSILGYVVRWIDQGTGCSKVPDIHGIALMEDRATLRISSQLLANWLLHGVISEQQVDAALEKCASVVNGQNSTDPSYEPLAVGHGIAFEAARRLIFEGVDQPNGYTEPLLHALRRRKKAAQAMAAAD